MDTDSRKKGIACAGNWIVDLIKVVDVYPPESCLANILSESTGGGGCAHNVTLNLAKFDPELEVHALGVVGNDANADFLLAQCRKFPNIHCRQLHRTNLAPTSYTDVFNCQVTGRRTFFHCRGANRLFDPSYVNLDDLPVSLLHLGYLLLLDAMDQSNSEHGTVAAAFLHDVQERGIQTSLDLVSENSSRFNSIIPAALKYTNFCIINDFEAARLSGLSIRCGNNILTENLSKIGRRLLAHGVQNLVVIHFPEGAYLLRSDGTEILQPSLQVPESFIVGSTGAGDSFCAGMLYGLYRDWALEKALRFATCAGALSLRDLTAVGAIRSWREVVEMETRFPFRKEIAL